MHEATPQPPSPCSPVEAVRTALLADYGLHEGLRPSEFDELATLAALVMEAPMACVNIMGADTVWSIGQHPVDAEPAVQAWQARFARWSLTADSREPFVVPDARCDERTAAFLQSIEGQAPVGSSMGFFAGVPILSGDGKVLGSLCVLGPEPRKVPDERVDGLAKVALQVQRMLQNRAERQQLNRRQEALAERQEAFEQAMEIAGETFWDWDLVTNRMGHARNRARMLGYDDLNEHLDQWVEVSHPEDRELVAQLIRAHLRGETPEYEAEYRQRHREGHWIWVRSRGRVTGRDPATGKPLRMRGTVVDITRRKELEAHIVQMNADLRAALRDSEEAARSKTQFLATMAHEIRTPLNSVVGASRLALMEEDPQQLEEHLQLVNQASQMLLDLLNTVLDHSRLESGALPTEQLPISVRQLVNLVGQQAGAAARVKGLQWTTRVDPSVPTTVLGDHIRLRQVLTNLVGNALKFTEKGSIELCARVEPSSAAGEGAMVCIDITDTGIGVSQEQQARLFKAFSQADSTIARRYGGTGLGLSISRQIMQALGGSLRLRSESGHGSTFTMRWPLKRVSAVMGPDVEVEARVPVQAAGSDSAAQVPPPAAPERGAEMARLLAEAGRTMVGRRVLVVDDNRMNLAVVRRLLERAGLSVVTAGSGSEALAILGAATVDLVLLDLYMPEMNGDEVARRIQDDLGLRRLPLMALSASVTMEERERCAAAGMVSFVSKPIDPLELLSAMADCLAS